MEVGGFVELALGLSFLPSAHYLFIWVARLIFAVLGREFEEELVSTDLTPLG